MIELVVGFVAVVLGLVFLGLWLLLPRKRVEKKPDGSVFIWRDRDDE